ncbi:hypothetical protein K505DRAFT_341741 [Melanomma pulvis-pyrius CBS 109.77]|uniref:Uncharacterized protein n=1 Tax=Melanomma pulvis-pyrius CBS 109.77 TaxID=1314802 RepID=A0A6A6WXN5_9PLEO|nr:hypothetical protein K505DRAFT_341741 [Melanomma pulvis-pyrius CBS 109.77]
MAYILPLIRENSETCYKCNAELAPTQDPNHQKTNYQVYSFGPHADTLGDCTSPRLCEALFAECIAILTSRDMVAVHVGDDTIRATLVHDQTTFRCSIRIVDVSTSTLNWTLPIDNATFLGQCTQIFNLNPPADRSRAQPVAVRSPGTRADPRPTVLRPDSILAVPLITNSALWNCLQKSPPHKGVAGAG